MSKSGNKIQESRLHRLKEQQLGYKNKDVQTETEEERIYGRVLNIKVDDAMLSEENYRLQDNIWDYTEACKAMEIIKKKHADVLYSPNKEPKLAEALNDPETEKEIREYLDQETVSQLLHLAASIQKDGLFYYPKAIKRLNGFEIGAGQRRFLATKLLEWDKIPVDLIESVDLYLVCMIENYHKLNNTKVQDAAMIYAVMTKYGMTKEGAAKLLAVSTRTAVRRTRDYDNYMKRQDVLRERRENPPPKRIKQILDDTDECETIMRSTKKMSTIEVVEYLKGLLAKWEAKSAEGGSV